MNLDRSHCIFVAALCLFFAWLGYWTGSILFI